VRLLNLLVTGLTYDRPLGKTLIQEMNRIGMVVDISHTSDDTANQALSLSLAPPIWSHSNARAVFDVRRSVPDSIVSRLLQLPFES
jgi:membrane dipeptidase